MSLKPRFLVSPNTKASGAVATAVQDALKSLVGSLLGGIGGKVVDLLKAIVARCGDVGCILDLVSQFICASAACDKQALVSLIKCVLLAAIRPLIQFLLDLVGADIIREALRGLLNSLRELICDAIKALMAKLLGGFCSGNQTQTCAPSGCKLPGLPALPPMVSTSCGTSPSVPAGAGVSACSLASSPGANCFVAGTPVHLGDGGVAPIEELRVGRRVRTYLEIERDGTPALPDTPILAHAWRVVRVALDYGDGVSVRADLLRSHDWIADYGAHVGGSVYLDMPEMGVVGEAQVLTIEPCPPLESGEGRLVTSTFRHEGGTALDLKLESESEPIGVTALHPLWNVDRQAWVSAIELEQGETVKTLAGTSYVESLVAREEVEPVLNIEVDGDHVYRVGDSGVLVHNVSGPGCGPLDPDEIAEKLDLEEIEDHGDPSNWTYQGEKPGSGLPSKSPDAPPGTIKCYEIWKDEHGDLLEVHYFTYCDGTHDDIKESRQNKLPFTARGARSFRMDFIIPLAVELMPDDAAL